MNKDSIETILLADRMIADKENCDWKDSQFIQAYENSTLTRSISPCKRMQQHDGLLAYYRYHHIDYLVRIVETMTILDKSYNEMFNDPRHVSVMRTQPC